jgi:plastocyanin
MPTVSAGLKLDLIKIFCLGLVFVASVTDTALAEVKDQHASHAQHNMTLNKAGLVMNSNHHSLPEDCEKVERDYNIKVYAGTKFASDYPGTVFGMSQHEYQVDPCSRVTLTFINEDEVRHQWMIHGLPRYLYPGGMFHLEAAGQQSQTGTFIVPSDNKTYLVHCDMAQHMEKGMKAQLKVGEGSGDLWAVPGVSTGFIQDNYLPEGAGFYLMATSLAGIAITTLAISRRRSRLSPRR